MYRIRDWGKYFENNRSRSCKEMFWVPVPNRLDGDGYTKLLSHPNGAAHYGSWMAVVLIASTCDPRGSLIKKGHPLDLSDFSRISRIPVTVFEESMPRFVSELKWIEEIKETDSGLPVDRQCADSTLHNITEQNRTTQNRRGDKFEVDSERFIREYPREVSGWEIQVLLSEVRAQADQDLLFKNLGLYRATDQWTRGIVPSAENFLGKGKWKVAPKDPVGAIRAISEKKPKVWNPEDHIS